MSLDNANPTVFQNAIGGGRTRFRDLFSSNPNKDSYDDFYHVGADEITKPRTIPDVDFWSQLIGEVEHETPKRETLPENDFIDAQEIYGLISTISDPEHPLTLGSLAVVNIDDIHLTPTRIDPTKKAIARVVVEITPTVTHCSLATVIGLGIRVRLELALPPNIRVDVRIKEGTHSSGDQNNKQLADKERVAAALENKTLMDLIRRMMETCE